MEARVQKWGNSLAVRIPKPFAIEVGLHPDAEVLLQVENGTLVITPRRERTYRLSELMAAVSRSNVHNEVPTGKAVGNESW